MGRRGRWIAALPCCLLVAGCTHVIDTAQPQREPLIAPITALQVGDLLSPDVQDGDGNLFTTVAPERCSGLAREVDPPFIADFDPAATDGGHWVAPGGEVFVEEMTGVYRADYDPDRALAAARATIESCRDVSFSVTTMRGRTHVFTLLPQADSGSPRILLWSFQGVDWACDSALVTGHNAAVEISTCSPANGYDVLALAHGALERIDALANTTV